MKQASACALQGTIPTPPYPNGLAVFADYADYAGKETGISQRTNASWAKFFQHGNPEK
jgi:hypothetical protein